MSTPALALIDSTELTSEEKIINAVFERDEVPVSQERYLLIIK